ncbi:hypothetical protein CEE39_09310 [bacterium (candidate division B38) B3_B38]|nr:MAG: hypothetical protein CEE39_09310 [bacterium (candidate division B38) B3_B38]
MRVGSGGIGFRFERAVIVVALFFVFLSLPINAGATDDPSLENCLRSIEGLFRNYRVELLRDFVSRGDRVSFSLPGIVPREGFFSREQLHFIFKDLFRKYTTLNFDFSKERPVNAGGSPIYLFASWVFQEKGSLRTSRGTIFFSLEKKGERWWVTILKLSI